MLEPDGTIISNNGKITLHMCKTCYSHVILKHQIPCISLVNNMYIGPLPSVLQDLSLAKECMVSCGCTKCFIIYLCADSCMNNTFRFTQSLPTDQHNLKGYIVIFPSHPENLGQILPPPLSKVITPICVIFVGSCKPTKEWLLEKAKPLVIGHEKVCTNLYKDILMYMYNIVFHVQ